MERYVKFNEDGTYGFYTPSMHGEEIIFDPTYKEISEELYIFLLNNQGLKVITPDLEIVDYIPPVTIDTEDNSLPIQTNKALTLMAQLIPDEHKVEIPLLFDTYESLIGTEVSQGFVFRHNDDLYRVELPKLIFDTTYIPGTPGLDALFTRLQSAQISGDIIDWFEPTSTNNYKKGDLVRFTDGLVYESGQDNNVTSPGSYQDPPFPGGWKRRPDLD